MMFIERGKFGRRTFMASAAALASSRFMRVAADNPRIASPLFRFRYIVGSCMYGYAPLEEILPEVANSGATAIDIWPKVHGNQREQIEAMGEAAFLELLKAHDTSVGCLTQYKLGPFGLQEEVTFANRMGCNLIVTGGKGPKGLSGSDLKRAVQQFIETMKPHLDTARENKVAIAIENHGNNLIQSPDSLKWLAEFRPDPSLGIALAPYHLPQDAVRLAKLIGSLGDSILMFYAWQHGMGCMEKLPKNQELLQMPGRGELDFEPLVKALRQIDYQGWTEIFMHPVPRGIPILETTAQVTAEINRARHYLEQFKNE